MAKITMAFQVVPKVDDSRIYEVVDQAIAVVAASGVPFEVGPLETTMEGEIDELLDIVKKAQEACVQAGASRVMTYIKIDYVPSGSSISEKIEKYRGK